MPIRPFLDGQAVDPQLVNAMSAAIERACDTLRLSCTTSDAATELVASKIIEAARTGARDVEALYAGAMQDFVARP